MDSYPPFEETYKTLLENSKGEAQAVKEKDIVEECELPLIDLSRINRGESEREECKREIAKASTEWGFFQAVNHGISGEILQRMRCEQVKLFRQPFNTKANGKVLNFWADSYRWGTPTATCLRELSWSEAFHIPLTDISVSGQLNRLRYSSILILHFKNFMERFT